MSSTILKAGAFILASAGLLLFKKKVLDKDLLKVKTQNFKLKLKKFEPEKANFC